MKNQRIKKKKKEKLIEEEPPSDQGWMSCNFCRFVGRSG